MGQNSINQPTNDPVDGWGLLDKASLIKSLLIIEKSISQIKMCH